LPELLEVPIQILGKLDWTLWLNNCFIAAAAEEKEEVEEPVAKRPRLLYQGKDSIKLD